MQRRRRGGVEGTGRLVEPLRAAHRRRRPWCPASRRRGGGSGGGVVGVGADDGGAVAAGVDAGGQFGGCGHRRRGRRVAVEDAAAGGQHPLSGVGHDRLHRLAGHVAGPVRHVRKRVAAAVEAGGAGDEVGDAFGFDFAGAAAAAGGAGEVGGVVQQQVGDLVGERLAGLRVVEVGSDGDGTRGEVGQAVGGGAVAAVDGEAAFGGQAGQGVPQPGRGLPAQQGRPRRGGQRLTAGLGDVPDVGEAEADEPAGRGTGRRGAGVACVVGGGRGGRVAGGAVDGAGHRGEDSGCLSGLCRLVGPSAATRRSRRSRWRRAAGRR